MRGKDDTAGQHNGHVTLGYVVHQILSHTGINEYHLNHDNAYNQICQVQHYHVDDRRNGIWKGVAGR